jgi:hypothetical protein
MIGLGVALVVLCALGSVYLMSMNGRITQVLAVSSHVERGETITAADLAAVDLPAGPTMLNPVPAAMLNDVVGQVATTELLPGSLLTSASITQVLAPRPGASIVGVSLGAHQMPASPLHPGDTVRIVSTPQSGAEPPTAAPEFITATVLAVAVPGASGQTVVDVEVDEAVAGLLAARAATGRVALVLEPAGRLGQ